MNHKPHMKKKPKTKTKTRKRKPGRFVNRAPLTPVQEPDPIPAFWRNAAPGQKTVLDIHQLAQNTGVSSAFWVTSVIACAIRSNALVMPQTGAVTVGNTRDALKQRQQCDFVEAFTGKRCPSTASHACMNAAREMFCQEHAIPMINAGFPMHSL